jgi:hypothetical protein
MNDKELDSEEERVLKDIDREGNVTDKDLHILRRLLEKRLIRTCWYEDYIGYQRVPKSP